jgi:hypothetical protein
MRKIMLFLAVFGLVGSLWAADPIIGKWKMNVAKSKFSPMEKAPKEFTEVYREIDGNLIELTTNLIESDGSSSPEKFTFPAQGGINKFLTPIEEGRFEIETLIAPGEWRMTSMLNGKQMRTMHKVISKDGKTMRHIVTLTDAQGKTTEALYVFDRQ